MWVPSRTRSVNASSSVSRSKNRSPSTQFAPAFLSSLVIHEEYHANNIVGNNSVGKPAGVIPAGTCLPNHRKMQSQRFFPPNPPLHTPRIARDNRPVAAASNREPPTCAAKQSSFKNKENHRQLKRSRSCPRRPARSWCAWRRPVCAIATTTWSTASDTSKTCPW